MRANNIFYELSIDGSFECGFAVPGLSFHFRCSIVHVHTIYNAPKEQASKTNRLEIKFVNFERILIDKARAIRPVLFEQQIYLFSGEIELPLVSFVFVQRRLPNKWTDHERHPPANGTANKIAFV